MAELILTEHEKQTLTYLEWDDAALGKAVKVIATIFEDNDGRTSLKATGAAIFLICEAIRNNSMEMNVDLEGAVSGDEQLGDWNIKLTRRGP